MEQTAKRGVFLSQINLGLSSPSSKARSCPHHFPKSQHSYPPPARGGLLVWTAGVAPAPECGSEPPDGLGVSPLTNPNCCR